MKKPTLERFRDVMGDLSATQIIFVLDVAILLQSRKESVESLSCRLQLPVLTAKDQQLNCDEQDLQKQKYTESCH